MKMKLLVSILTPFLLTGCSKFFSPCESADVINEVKIIINQNLQKMTDLVCSSDQYCDVKIEIKNINLVSENDFSKECTAVGKAVVKVNDENFDHQKLKIYILGSSIFDLRFTVSTDSDSKLNVKASTSNIDATIERNFIADSFSGMLGDSKSVAAPAASNFDQKSSDDCVDNKIQAYRAEVGMDADIRHDVLSEFEQECKSGV